MSWWDDFRLGVAGVRDLSWEVTRLTPMGRALYWMRRRAGYDHASAREWARQEAERREYAEDDPRRQELEDLARRAQEEDDILSEAARRTRDDLRAGAETWTRRIAIGAGVVAAGYIALLMAPYVARSRKRRRSS